MNTTLFFPAAIWVDNVPLTDQGREPVQMSRDERSVVNELASGKRMKYVKAIKHTFSLRWNFLPDEASDTIDGGGAHDTMSVLGESGDVHTLRFYNRNGSWNEYTVFVSSYDETLVRRDSVSGGHFWEVSMNFEEQ